MADYYRFNVSYALENCGVKKGDVALCHASLWQSGEPARDPGLMVLAAFRRVLGPEGALLVPAFTYSTARGKAFDPLRPPPEDMGMLARAVFADPESQRSRDPMFSVLWIGRCSPPGVDECFGEGSIWWQLLCWNAWIVNINCKGSTFLHYVERDAGVSYRKDREFEHDDQRCVFFSRDLGDPTAEPDFSKFTEAAKAEGLMHTAELGRGEVTAIRTKDAYRLVRYKLITDPEFLVKGEAA